MTPLPSSSVVQQRAQFGLVVRRHDDIAHRQLDRVLAETVQARPRIDRQELAVDAQMRVAARLGPLGQIGVDALAVDHQRRQQAHVLAAMIAQQLGGDRLRALRSHRRAVVHAMLDAELDVEQPQEVPDLDVVATVLLRPPRDGRCSIATVGGMP
jgi:hypothetical protein